jgi:hypothetical protein
VKIDRRQAIRDYKLRKIRQGVFAVRCTVSGKVWIGSSLDLDKAQNREWFVLQSGAHYNAVLQREWNIHGEKAFEYKILETLDEAVSQIRLNDVLKELRRQWIERQGAEPIHS